MKLVFIAFVVVFATSAYAETYSLICENPRREYTVAYSDGDRYIQANDGVNETAYTVLAVEKTEEKFVVAAQTPNGGPSVCRPYLRMSTGLTGSSFKQTPAGYPIEE